MKGQFKRYLQTCRKDWGNKSKSAKRAMRNAAKQSARRKFNRDFNIAYDETPTDLELGVKVVNRLSNGTELHIPINKYKFPEVDIV